MIKFNKEYKTNSADHYFPQFQAQKFIPEFITAKQIQTLGPGTHGPKLVTLDNVQLSADIPDSPKVIFHQGSLNLLAESYS